MTRCWNLCWPLSLPKETLAKFNAAGIEIENSYYADVYNNIGKNTGGILVFDLPNLPKQGGIVEFLIISHLITTLQFYLKNIVGKFLVGQVLHNG